MKFEDLIINREETVDEQSAILRSKLVEIRTANRKDILNRWFDTDDETHRMERVTTFRGVHFINDSKACSVNATYYCMETIKSDIIWIAGGNDENAKYIELAGHVSQKVKALVCIGKDNQKLITSFRPCIERIYECQDMEDAVRRAFYSAEPGNFVLLSAGCDCDELYPDYKTRGNLFKRAIAQL
ncbi:MAG: hypothetical protein LBQ64_05285 [Bacteroidales bacterium]|jgi:UDP-N-acetylmuramoylalanine--D-glutamate ligase|nr:hypothetical protein [Bacteroidales bacterium]